MPQFAQIIPKVRIGTFEVGTLTKRVKLERDSSWLLKRPHLNLNLGRRNKQKKKEIEIILKDWMTFWNFYATWTYKDVEVT